MRLGANATVISYKPTGVGVFAINMLINLSLLIDHFTIWTVDKNLVTDVDADVKEILPFLPRWFRCNEIIRCLWDQFWFPYILRKEKLSIVFFPVQEGMMFPPVPQIIFLHDLAPIKFPYGVPFLRRLSYQFRIPIVLKHSVAVAVPTDAIRKELLSTFSFLDHSKVHVIGEGYEKTHFKPALYLDTILPEPYFLFMGSLCQNKNLIRIIEAFASIKDYKISLLLAGKPLDPRYANKVHELVLHCGIKKTVHFLNYVPYQQLPQLYTQAKALVFPSLYEGFGLPIIEAMACGTPVITSDCSSMQEVAGDAAILVDPYSVESIANAMRDILEKPARVAELKKAGLDRVKQFTWTAVAEKMYKLLSEMV